MGVGGDWLRGAVRFSLGRGTTAGEIDRVARSSPGPSHGCGGLAAGAGVLTGWPARGCPAGRPSMSRRGRDARPGTGGRGP